jgi:hypothetical protein
MTTPARPSAFTQLVSTADWEALLSAAGIGDGVDGTQSAGTCVPSLDTVGRNAVIGPGNVIIKGELWSCSSAVSTPIPGPSSQNRIDMLVMQLNRGATTAATVIQPVVLTGTPSGSPAPPAITQTPTGLFQIPICQWTSTSAGALTGLTDIRQFSIDTWHSLAIPGSPSGLSGAFRYKAQRWDIVKIDATLVWSGSSGQTWTFPSMPQPWWWSIPGNQPRIYAGLGNTTMSSGAGTQFPRLFLGSAGSIQFISAGNMDSGAASFTIDIPMD